jgi:metallophosphoesterase (TIGR03767 family)
MSPRRMAMLAALAPLIAAPAVALADPAGKTTLDETVRPASGTGFVPLVRGRGEAYVVRRGPGAKASSRRARERRSLVYFGQLTDPQIADEMSPARVDFADPGGGELKSSWRPQEALGTQTFDSVVRNMNANRISPVRQGNRKKAKMAFAITTGDLADNQQLNESRWFKTVLDGGPLDPFSGKVVSPANPCGGAKPEEIAKLNADVAARNYTGVADYDDYRKAPADRFEGFYDPDEAPPTGKGPYAGFPRYPGLLERAQKQFDAAGLDVPWFISRGNHDGLVQGNAPASEDLFRSIATGCLKVFPSAAFDPSKYSGASSDALFASFADPKFIASLLAGAGKTPPDPDRRLLSKADFKALVGTTRRRGFGYVDKTENAKSKGTASYYAWTPKKGLRFVSLDTVAEGGGQSGNLDDAQYKWLEKTLRAARKRHELVVAFGHHTLATMDNARTDEQAGKCDPPGEPGCDADPRASTPLHRGTAGKKTVRDLFLKYRIVAYVAGHTHSNRVDLFKKGKSAFWQINTASHIDWPQQSRVIEIMDNRDGTLSLFGTVLDAAAPDAAPAPGSALGFDAAQLASLSRTLSYNDPQRDGAEGSAGTAEKRGRRGDRNVELLLRDPR